MTSIPSKRSFENGGDRAGEEVETNEDDGINKRTKTINAAVTPATKPAAAALRPTLRSLSYKEIFRTNDEIHGDIAFCPVMAVVVNTPPFQRLRGLKQLGAADLVYVCADHSRFAHSCGVAHLASKMCTKIRGRQPKLGVTDKDVLIVTLAGLLHDIGHGPFSHVYEQFIKKKLPAYLDRHEHLRANYEGLTQVDREKWGHEKVSLAMVDKILEHLGLQIDLDNLDKPLKQVGYGEHAIDARSMKLFNPALTNDEDLILTSRDWVCVKECIWGKPIPSINQHLDQEGFIGRPEREKEWLYQIVNNCHSGLDVDKMDYFARDERRAKGEQGKVFNHFIEDACVTWAACCIGGCESCRIGKSHYEMHLQICYPDKTAKKEAIRFFEKRYELHSEIYKHKTIRAAGNMICDVLCTADPFFRLRADGKMDGLPISQAMQDCDVFLNLRDSVVDQILADTNPALDEAQQLIQRLRTRKLYKCAAEANFTIDSRYGERIAEMKEAQIHKEILSIGGKHDRENGNVIELDAEDFLIDISDIHHGKKSGNPVEAMRFLEKDQWSQLPFLLTDELPEAHKSPFAARLKPREIVLRAYSRNSVKSELVSHAFQSWLHDMQHGFNPNSDVGMLSNVVAMSQDEEDSYDDQMASPTPTFPASKFITRATPASSSKWP